MDNAHHTSTIIAGDAVRVVIVDDDVAILELLPRLLIASGLDVVACHDSGVAAVKAAAGDQADVTLVDVHMPDLDGVDVTRALVAASVGGKVLALTSMATDDEARRMLEAGAIGFVAKTGMSTSLVAAIRAAAAGLSVLSPHVSTLIDARVIPPELANLTAEDRELLRHVRDGLTNVEIGKLLHRSDSAIKHRISGLMRLVGVSSRTTLVIRVSELGLLPGSGHR